MKYSQDHFQVVLLLNSSKRSASGPLYNIRAMFPLYVAFQVVFPVEGHVTLGAFKRAVSSVGTHMPHKFREHLEALATHIATVGFR